MIRFIRILTLLLFAGCLTARGQELRTGIPTAGGGYLAAGDRLCRLDAEGTVLENLPLARPLRALASLDGRLYALDAAGRQLLELNESGVIIAAQALGTQGRLRALGEGDETLWAVTDAGEILRSEDGRRWSLQDFNAEYDGYYPRMDFRAVAAGGGAVMVAGLDEAGRLAVFSSSRGSVWSARPLEYGGGQVADFEPVSLGYDPLRDAFCLAGGGGTLFTMPGCTHCNRLDHYPADVLYARIPNGFSALLLGSGGLRKTE